MTVSLEELHDRLQPATPLEASFLEDLEYLRGLEWGLPRYGHPEGSIWRHIIEVNNNIDRLPAEVQTSIIGAKNQRTTRECLRIISWVHDTFKHIEDKSSPRDWSKHHSIYARQFLACFIEDEQLLTIVELHDEAYYVWRLLHLMQRPKEAAERLKNLRSRVGDYWQLYYLFFKCDTCTGDKNPAPMNWFEQNMEDIKLVNFLPSSPGSNACAPRH